MRLKRRLKNKFFDFIISAINFPNSPPAPLFGKKERGV